MLSGAIHINNHDAKRNAWCIFSEKLVSKTNHTWRYLLPLRFTGRNKVDDDQHVSR